MKKSSLSLCVFCASVGAFSASGAGFALYEASAAATAMGGAVMGKAVDASAVFYNPATMTDFTNTVISVGLISEHPTSDVSVNSRSSTKMDPGFFLLPHANIVQPLPWDFTFGFTVAPEFGLGSHYRQDWAMDWNTRETTIEGVVFGPHLAYKITDDWSVAAGLRFLYLTFEQLSDQQAVSSGYNLGTIRDHLKGDNGCLDWGWEISTKYDITKKLHFGAMYRSYIDAHVKGYNHTSVKGYNENLVNAVAYYAGTSADMIKTIIQSGAASANGAASAKVRLPASLSVGLNYDLTDEIELGTVLTWTQWSTIDNLNFNLPGDNDTSLHLGWKDTYRLGLGFNWRFVKDWSWMGSYIFDMDPCRSRYGSTMLPAGDRHLVSTGLSWRFAEHWEISTVFSYIIMCEDSLYLTDKTGKTYKFDTHKGRSMAFGATLSYYF